VSAAKMWNAQNVMMGEDERERKEKNEKKLTQG
jgi:hypothetical protein